MRILVYERRASAAQIDSLDLMKINNVTTNANQPEPRKTNKITKVVTTAQYAGNTQIHPLGRELIRIKRQRKRQKKVDFCLVKSSKFPTICPTNFLY